MNIFLRELKAYRKSTLIWIVSLSLLAFVFLNIFPAFTQDVESFRSILSKLPIQLRDTLDISLQSFFTIYGFFAYLLTFATLAGAVQAMNIGVGMLSKEFNGKTMDFLLTKPVSRTKVMTSKILASVCLILFTNLVFSITALITAKIISNESFDSDTFLLISATLLLVQVFFLALGTLFSVVIPKIKSVIAVSLPTVFTFFIIGMLGSIIGDEKVRYITPFKFFDSTYIINHSAYEMKFLAIEIVFIMIAITASYIIYMNKDVRTSS